MRAWWPARTRNQRSDLLCPLYLQDRPAGEPLIGVLAVSGASRDLAELAGTFEVLARQAALVVERVELSREVIRRNGEAYFRTLVHDTSDVILIVDDSGRVRYATPSAQGIFGDVPVDGEYLWDLVRPDEREEIARALAEMRTAAAVMAGTAGTSMRTGGSRPATAPTWRWRSGAATCGTSPPSQAWCSRCGT